jgi:2-keto-4-pentenoate hydratase
MNQQQIADAARLLVAARNGERLAELPVKPESVAEAHAIQDAVAAALGEPVGAFKANAPPNEEPSRGLIYARTIRPTPAQVPAAEAPDRGVEGEVAFRCRLKLPPRAEPYTREEVAAAMDACAAIEVVSGRFRDHAARTPLEKLADCVINAGFVHAEPVRDWQKLDLAKLPVTLSVNGAAVLQQVGGHPIGDPLGVAVALVNMMRSGTGVQVGQFVTCGSCTGLRFLKQGDTCSVHFEGLGTAEVTFSA